MALPLKTSGGRKTGVEWREYGC